MAIFLKKLKARKGKGVQISYRHERGENKESELITIECEEEARPELYETLNKLRPWMSELLLLPMNYFNDETCPVEVIGVTITESDEGDQLVTTAIKHLPGKVAFVMNTPNCLADSNDCLHVIHDLNIEAKEYIDGKRAQLNLFDSEQKTGLMQGTAAK